MKHIYFLTTLFILAISSKSYSQIAAEFNTDTTGTLSGIPFKITNINNINNNHNIAYDFSLSTSDFSAAPISPNPPILEIDAEENWTVTFDSPIPNLRLYCKFFRTNLYEFDQPFTILSGGTNFTNPNGNQLNTVMFSDGIIEFTNPITTLNTNYISGDFGGISFTFGLADQLTVSVSEELNTKSNISIYPNPSNDFIQLSSLSQIDNYVIYNTLGIQVSSGIISNNERIDIQNLTNGIYFLKLDNGSTLKFIKK